MSTTPIDSQFAYEMQGLSRLKNAADKDQGKALKEASKQFEALFLNQMLKTMRAAIPQSNLHDSEATRMYTEMLDSQLAQKMSGKGFGLAELIESQLKERGLLDPQAQEQNENLIAGIPRGMPRSLGYSGSSAAIPASRTTLSGIQGNPFALPGDDNRPAHVKAFMSEMQGSAVVASRISGVPAEVILAQAALETGWGKSRIQTESGADSHNLFGIKAGQYWRGEVAQVTTTEFVDGQARKQVDGFRVYGSKTEGFADYGRLITQNPRYQGVLAASTPEGAARALQEGGYATDPEYANKLIAVMNTMGPVREPVRTAQLDDRYNDMINKIW